MPFSCHEVNWMKKEGSSYFMSWNIVEVKFYYCHVVEVKLYISLSYCGGKIISSYRGGKIISSYRGGENLSVISWRWTFIIVGSWRWNGKCWWTDGPSLGRLDSCNKLPDEELSCLEANSTKCLREHYSVPELMASIYSFFSIFL